MVKPTGISLDTAGATPIFRQIADQILHRIRTGAFPEGHRLPPTRQLATELATHRNTVVRAYEELEATGLVESVVGRGTFVSAGAAAPATATPGSAPSLPWESLVTNSPAAEPLRRYAQFARAVPAGDVVDLSRMQPSPDLLPADQLRRAIDHVLRTRGARALGYAPREGLPRLRALIAEDLTRRGVPARAEDVVITSGSQQAIDLVARMLVRPGDLFLVNHSTYGGAIDVLTAAGARLVGVPSDGEGPDLEALERLAGAGAKGLYLMPNCANPTGEVVSTRRREQLVA
jgi:GntR family transcriptional regulator/MocR family aminotransferase